MCIITNNEMLATDVNFQFVKVWHSCGNSAMLVLSSVYRLFCILDLK